MNKRITSIVIGAMIIITVVSVGGIDHYGLELFAQDIMEPIYTVAKYMVITISVVLALILTIVIVTTVYEKFNLQRINGLRFIGRFIHGTDDDKGAI